jgi:F-type H+-transporting ATPase subunit a
MASEAHGDSGEIVLHLPTFLDFTGLDLHRPYFGFDLYQWIPVIMCLLVGITLVGFSLFATRKMEKVPRGAQALAEIIVEGLFNFLQDLLGRQTGRYLPFLGTLFLYIITMNFWGLLPLMEGPTHALNTTLSMAIVVFFFYNIEGLRKKRWGYIGHFFQPLFLAPLMFPLHVIGELFRPIALSLRLMGNMTGKGLVLSLLVFFTPFIFGFIPVPIHLLMVLMALLLGAIQAMIFTMLSAIYLSLATEEDEEH